MGLFDKKRTLTGLFFLALGIFFLYQISLFKYSFPPEPGTLHPMAFPRVLMWIWCALSVLYILVPRDTFHAEELLPVLPRIGCVVALIAAFIVLIRYVGFIPSGIFLLLGVFWLLDYRVPTRAIPLAVACIVVMWAVFTYGMKMPLPELSL